jgi:hypothetical protein
VECINTSITAYVSSARNVLRCQRQADLGDSRLRRRKGTQGRARRGRRVARRFHRPDLVKDAVLRESGDGHAERALQLFGLDRQSEPDFGAVEIGTIVDRFWRSSKNSKAHICQSRANVGPRDMWATAVGREPGAPDPFFFAILYNYNTISVYKTIFRISQLPRNRESL